MDGETWNWGPPKIHGWICCPPFQEPPFNLQLFQLFRRCSSMLYCTCFLGACWVFSAWYGFVWTKGCQKKTENHCHVLFKVVICGFNSLPDKPTITFGGLHQLTITSHEYPNLLWYQPIFGWRWPKPSISVQTIQGFPKVYLEKWDTCVLYNYIWYIYIIYIYTCIYIYIYIYGFP